MNPIQFKPEPEPARTAVVATFDLSDFTPFCEQGGAPALVNRYLSHLFQTLDQAFVDPWRDHFKAPQELIQVRRPDFAKFTGNGALLLWFRNEEQALDGAFAASLVAALRNFQQRLPAIVSAWEQQWQCPPLPKIVRIGISGGSVHPLRTTASRIFSESVDYAGDCLNRAFWLQNHCPEVGFMMDAALEPTVPGLIQLLACRVKGTRNAPVFVFQEDYERAAKVANEQVGLRFMTGLLV